MPGMIMALTMRIGGSMVSGDIISKIMKMYADPAISEVVVSKMLDEAGLVAIMEIIYPLIVAHETLAAYDGAGAGDAEIEYWVDDSIAATAIAKVNDDKDYPKTWE